MIDHLIGRVADDPAVPLVPGLGAAGLGALALILAIGRGRLGRGARGLLRTLQPQHQLDQLLLAQTLKIAAAHECRESAIRLRRKGWVIADPFCRTRIRPFKSKFGSTIPSEKSASFSDGI